ncbi:MAG: DUF5652 family protein [Candidatus Pacearchaeota archaeon]|jgi:TRAP-type mannitol/chloroaromatic compound transport system permease small subunit
MATTLDMIASNIGMSVGMLVLLFVLVVIWTVVWKALALWRSARMNHIVWFIVFLIVNLLGIPEIIYLIVTEKAYYKRKRR